MDVTCICHAILTFLVGETGLPAHRTEAGTKRPSTVFAFLPERDRVAFRGGVFRLLHRPSAHAVEEASGA